MKPSRITNERMDRGYFDRRLDGLRHGRIPAVPNTYCQYCYYQWTKFDDTKKEAFNYMCKNRGRIWRCLLCNVNLCPVCDMEFHGISMQDKSKLLGKK